MIGFQRKGALFFLSFARFFGDSGNGQAEAVNHALVTLADETFEPVPPEDHVH